MTKFFIYTPDMSQYLGQLEAVDSDAAHALASHLWNSPTKILGFRLQLDRRLAV